MHESSEVFRTYQDLGNILTLFARYQTGMSSRASQGYVAKIKTFTLSNRDMFDKTLLRPKNVTTCNFNVRNVI